MPRKDIYKDAKGFDKNPQNINRTGPNRKLVSTVLLELKEKGIEPVSPKEIKDIYLSLLNMPMNEIKALVEDDKQPSINRIVAKALLSGKGFEVIKDILDRAIGKATQIQDITTQGEKISPTIIQLPPPKEME